MIPDPIKQGIQEIISKRDEIIENYLKAWLALNIPENVTLKEAAGFYINNCVLVVKDYSAYEDGKYIQTFEYRMEYRNNAEKNKWNEANAK